MEEKNNQNSFHYFYSAREQKEIQTIRNKYIQPQETENQLEQLRRLDAGVTKKGMIVSLLIGIIGTLMLGIGMCCCMIWDSSPVVFVIGIVIGLSGILCISLAYPLYTRIIKKERHKIAPEIIRLTDELIK